MCVTMLFFYKVSSGLTSPAASELQDLLDILRIEDEKKKQNAELDKI